MTTEMASQPPKRGVFTNLVRRIGQILYTRLVLAFLGLLAGYLIFAYLLGGVPKVAVMNGPVGVIDTFTAQEVALKLRLAASDPQIKAVVIRIDSPGGLASASEDLFTNVLHLRSRKPVVVYVDGLAASGGYFMAAAADQVVAKGTSIVGNVGAILSLPPRDRPSESTVATGPFKLTGGSERTYLQILELVKEGFAEATFSQRKGRLRLSREELLQGRVYLGIEAEQLGLVDSLGTEVDAVRKAADLARLRRYQVVRIEELPQLTSATGTGQTSMAADKPGRGSSLYSLEPQFPYVYYLFVPP